VSEAAQPLGYNGNYGLELIADLKGCDLTDLTRERITQFVVELCDRVDMHRHGDPLFWEDHSGIPHLDGISAIQFIKTSNIVCHALPVLKAVYLNLFTCKPFDTDDALAYCKEFWCASSATHSVVTRV
jgi:S-adenosylmethionine decarboxylase